MGLLNSAKRKLTGLSPAGAGSDLVETGCAPLRRLQPALVSTELLRYDVVLTMGSGQWENGYVESFNGKLRDELLNRELFLSLAEARWVIDRWRLDYNHHRIHSALDYQTPAAFAAGCVLPASATPQPPEHSRIT